MSATDALDQERLNLEDIEFLKTLRRTFESMSMGNRSRVEGAAPEIESDTSNSTWKSVYDAYKVKSDELIQEMNDLRQLFVRIGGDQTVTIIEVLEDSPTHIHELDKALSNAVDLGSDGSVAEVMRCLINVWLKCEDLEDALYSQKHAFNFIHLQRLKEACKTTENEIHLQTGAKGNLALIFNDIVPRLSEQNFPGLINELRTFSTKILPSYVIQDEERATTKYLALTTIATFFSSITATTLQFSYLQTASGLSSAVNLFWFISLVFSVSSGINSLLSMIWRRSIVYTTIKPPKYIVFWLTKAPIAFLAIAAFAFIVGLNLFPYSSGQHIYVSSATNVFTVLHVLCLLFVISWYLVKLKWSTFFIQSFRRHLLWIFGYDDRVVRVNATIAIMTGWPKDPKMHPHPFAKLLRHCVTVLSYLKRKAKETITPINLWAKQYIIHSLSKFVKDVFKRISTTLTDVKRHLKQTHFENSSSILRDPEHGIPEGTNDGAISEGVSEVDRAVDSYLSSMDKMFAEPYHQHYFRTMINDWKSGFHSTDTREKGEKNMLWGYPALYRQFAEEVLPAMRAVDGLNSRPGPLQADQQSQDSDVPPRPEGSDSPSGSILPPASIPRREGTGGRAGDDGVRAPSVSGSASDSDGGLGYVLSSSSKGGVNILDHDPGSINSNPTADPVSADADERY